MAERGRETFVRLGAVILLRSCEGQGEGKPLRGRKDDLGVAPKLLEYPTQIWVISSSSLVKLDGFRLDPASLVRVWMSQLCSILVQVSRNERGERQSSRESKKKPATTRSSRGRVFSGSTAASAQRLLSQRPPR